jgi:hypothetical protein
MAGGGAMTEAEILTLLESYTEQQMQLIIQVVSLHFALVIAVFYFLHRSGLIMKFAVFGLYTIGNLLFLGLIYNLSLKVVAVRQDLLALQERGVELSAISQTVLDNLRPFINVASMMANIAFVALWIGAVYFLFFWKKRES